MSKSFLTKHHKPSRLVMSRALSQNQLFENEPLTKVLLDSTPNMVLILNGDGRIVYGNRAFLEFSGLDELQIIGYRPGDAMQCLHAVESKHGCGTTDFCQFCGQNRAIQIAAKGTFGEQECHILQHQSKHGTALDLKVRTSPVNLSAQTFTLMTLTDISGEKRRQALERIFFHDVLNTASVMLGMLSMMKKTPESNNGAMVDVVYKSAGNLVDEIRAQRQLLAAERSELVVHPAPISSLSFLQKIAEDYREHHFGSGDNIVISPSACDIEIVSDKTLLRRVLVNMVKNALEASRRDDVITLGCDVVNQQVRFWVHNPAFMPREVQLQLFKRSFSTKGNDRGLGTYSMKLLSENYLQGAISFSSTEDEGTFFYATYPLSLLPSEERNEVQGNGKFEEIPDDLKAPTPSLS